MDENFTAIVYLSSPIIRQDKFMIHYPVFNLTETIINAVAAAVIFMRISRTIDAR